MKTRWTATSVVLCAACLVGAQGGFGGGGMGGYGGGGFQGGFGGGGMGGYGGLQGSSGMRNDGGRQAFDQRVRDTDSKLMSYLSGEGVKSIVTPGEYCEWPLDLKAGQVVIASAESESFDPALEVVDQKDKIAASNDDRFPGDQRPLLLWRSEAGGAYKLRVRCFKNRSGGQVLVRFVIYDSVDLSDKPVEKKFDHVQSFLFRVPMKAGQIKQILFEKQGVRGYTVPSLGPTISPVGLPDAELGAPMSGVMEMPLVAAVDGDYYVVGHLYGGSTEPFIAKARETVPTKLSGSGSTLEGSAPSGAPAVWQLDVKAGEVLQFEAASPRPGSTLQVMESPPFSSYDLSKPEQNPFAPSLKPADADAGPAFSELPARAKDGRVAIVSARRDAKLWIVTRGWGADGKLYTVKAKPAARPFAEGNECKGKLGIGWSDYWSFDAKVGDVMTFDFGATSFAEKAWILGPDLRPVWNWDSMPDGASTTWKMVARVPGHYLVGIGAEGDGGSGDYHLQRKTYPAKEFTKGSPATGSLAQGETHVWRFTAKPGEPLFVHYKWNGGISVMIRDPKGADVWVPATYVDGSNAYGILTVTEPQTYMFVLTGSGAKSNYLIEFTDIPGYQKGK